MNAAEINRRISALHDVKFTTRKAIRSGKDVLALNAQGSNYTDRVVVMVVDGKLYGAETRLNDFQAGIIFNWLAKVLPAGMPPTMQQKMMEL